MTNYEQIIKDTNFSDIDIFFENYEDFEEISIIDFFSQINQFKKYIDNNDNSGFLLKITVECFKQVLTCAKKRFSENQLSNFFLAITITDTEQDVEENGFFIPNIMVSQQNNIFHFLDKPHERINKTDLSNLPIIQKYGNILQSFEFYQEIWPEQYVERIFIVPKNKYYGLPFR